MALEKLFSGKGEFGDWIAGPFLRAYVVGPLIFTLQLICTLIPGLNFITSFVFGWWANLDYYSYSYELFAGPKIPASWVMKTFIKHKKELNKLWKWKPNTLRLIDISIVLKYKNNF